MELGTTSNLSRRGLLGAAALTGLAAATGCTTATPGAGPSGPGTGSTGGDSRPTRVPFAGIKADIPATNPNAIDGYLSFPAARTSILPEKLGISEPVKVLAPLSIFTPPPMASNAFWQNLNDQLGVTLDIAMVPGADYTNQFQARIAGGDIPEMVRIPSVPKLDDLLKSRFADLTEHLAGDAVKDYPMLANLPSSTWDAAMFDGAVRGVPMHLLPIANRLEARMDVIESLGQSVDFSSAEDFLAFCRAVTDPRANRYAMVSPYPSNFTRQMCGVPNTWAVEGGRFTHEVETPQYEQWLELLRRMWSEGLFHPQALANPQVALLFQSGQFLLFEVGGAGFTSAMPVYTKNAPGLRVAPVAPPKYDGGGPAPVYLGRGSNGFTAIRKDVTPARVKDLLRVLNVLAAPFGTKEWLHVQYGKEGTDFTWVEGKGPSLTETGTKEKIVANYLPGSPMVMFSPGYEDTVRAECAFESTVGPTALPLPTNGLYSAEDSSAGAKLNVKIMNATLDVIAGRRPVTEWSGIVREWRAGGGDAIRAEYQDGYAKLHG